MKQNIPSFLRLLTVFTLLGGCIIAGCEQKEPSAEEAPEAPTYHVIARDHSGTIVGEWDARSIWRFSSGEWRITLLSDKNVYLQAPVVIATPTQPN